MLRTYLRTSLRFLVKNKTFTLINVAGLAIGTLCCIYIVLYVKDQHSYDGQFGAVYRITTETRLKGDSHRMATASPPIAPAMKTDLPEVEQYTRAIPTLGVDEHLVSYKERAFYERDAYFVDSTFFDVFTYHFTAGSPAQALLEPNAIVLIKPIADKLFGAENPIGKVITIKDSWGNHDFSVTGVIDQSLGKTSLPGAMFIRMNAGGYGGDFLTNHMWSGNNFTYSYVRLRTGANPAAVEAKLPAFLQRHAEDQLRSIGMEKVLHLQPVSSIHTTTDYESEAGKTVGAGFLRILILIAVLIQIIACINFMNLSTARASKRAKEVGIRKVIGAPKSKLVVQFIGESFLMALAGVLVALPILSWCLPYLNGITGADIRLTALLDYQVWLVLAGIVLVTGLAAGSYPAFYLSAFQVIKVIKGNFTNHISAGGIRRSLVVFQFALSIVLITGIIVIYGQMSFIRHKDLGFDKDQQLIFTFHTDDTRHRMPAFETDLRGLPEVKTVSRVNNTPGAASYYDWQVFLAGGSLADAVDQQTIYSDENMVKALGLHLIRGRDFHVHDSGSVIINETLASRLGLKPENAPGIRLYTGDASSTYTIVGVMKDINYRSLHDNIAPFMIMYNPDKDDINRLIVRTNSRDYTPLLEKIQEIWKRDLPGTPFDFAFLDDTIQRQYETEVTTSHIINSFALMAILISCLGLFGLAAFSAEQRSKEIGIRKVLGASVSSLVGLLSTDFLKLVCIAFLIAAPVSGWIMHRWLQGFAYRIGLEWWMFALAGLTAMLIALATVSFQAIKAAVVNPVRSLRTE